jgi:hypothetical protein
MINSTGGAWMKSFCFSIPYNFRMIFVAGPLGQIIVYIHNPQTIKDMARWFECPRNF